MAARLAWLVLALVLCAPALDAGARLAATSLFLVEFLSEGRWRPLSAITGDPSVGPIPALARNRPVPVDLYAPRAFRRPSGLVLAHGLAPLGKDDPRVRDAARLLARAGWAVAVPTVDGLTRLRLRPEDAGAVAAAVGALREARYEPVSLLGVSLGGGPALLAATDAGLARGLSAVLVLGGYASTRELLRYTLTGAYAFGSVRGRRAPDEEAIALFARANAELVDEAGRRLVENRNPQAVDALVAALPAQTRRLLDDLSPEERIARLRAPLFLIHGRDDPAVPFSESLRLLEAARAAGRPARAAIVGAVGHVEPDRRATLGEILRLWATVYAFAVYSEWGEVSAAPRGSE